MLQRWDESEPGETFETDRNEGRRRMIGRVPMKATYRFRLYPTASSFMLNTKRDAQAVWCVWASWCGHEDLNHQRGGGIGAVFVVVGSCGPHTHKTTSPILGDQREESRQFFYGDAKLEIVKGHILWWLPEIHCLPVLISLLSLLQASAEEGRDDSSAQDFGGERNHVLNR